ncbi:RNA-guided pseudouridylation complex pseudouridine synthase subunit Cbf5 [archaeon CG10_big_fil_rev_8_21_14_0_10_43_11]|nr:MAG: RNA-guided pseudouridylation complex pseudouridine synthase subunit Cbf5 [archaeon CG10_big_fil_rev_8_21_14_0_10_43_11]
MILKQNAVAGTYGVDPATRSVKERFVSGIIILDKPRGPRSQQAMDFLKRVLHVKKAGYSGTLDPNVTGVLPVGLNNATRVLQFLLLAPKEYVCVMRLHADVPEARVREVMNDFLGTITQRVPKRSAVKRQVRERSVHTVDLIEIKGRAVLFKTNVQSGTYIRMLCHDIGEKLGCGANMAELRRTRVADLTEEYAVTLDQLRFAYDAWQAGNDEYLAKVIHPIEVATTHLKKMVIIDSAVASVAHGAALKIPGIAWLDEGIERGEAVGVFTLKGELVGVGAARLSSAAIDMNNEGVAVDVHTVMIDRSLYPKAWKKQNEKESE